MDAISLIALADEQLTAAYASSSGRSSHVLHRSDRRALRQIVLALVGGRSLGEHDSAGEATLQVLIGRVRLSTGDDSVEAAAGDQVAIPRSRHDLTAIEDCVVLLSLVNTDPA